MKGHILRKHTLSLLLGIFLNVFWHDFCMRHLAACGALHYCQVISATKTLTNISRIASTFNASRIVALTRHVLYSSVCWRRPLHQSSITSRNKRDSRGRSKYDAGHRTKPKEGRECNNLDHAVYKYGHPRRLSSRGRQRMRGFFERGLSSPLPSIHFWKGQRNVEI